MAKRKLLPIPDTFHKNIGKIEEQSGKMFPSWFKPVAWLMCWPTVNQKLSGRQLNLSVEAMLITGNAWEILFMYKSLFSAGSHRESSIYAEQGCL